jgi:TrmH family RNA methyltransferase
VLILEDAVTKYQDLINSLTNPQAIKLVPIEIMRKLNILDSLSEIVAVIKIKPTLAEPSLTQDSLVLENIQDPGNLGTILRAAYASGITQIVLSPKSVDVYNPKVLRASQGIQFGLQIYTEIELGQWLDKYRGQVLAMVPQANLNLYQQDLLLTTALVLGNEGNGLSRELLAQLKTQISIPMLGGAESLNLAMAATIGLFEMSRQRVVNQRK